MPAIAGAQKQSYGAVQPEISTGNTTVLNHSQVSHPPCDADKALLLVVLMGFALGGKKTDNSIVLTKNYQGKLNKKGNGPGPSQPGPSQHDKGLLHSFIFSENIIESLWINLLTNNSITNIGLFSSGVGVAPWENMPQGEACPIAENLKNSLIGRLIPLSRFCLFLDDGLHYTEGIAHLDYKSGIFDPTMAVDLAKNQALQVNPEKRPWRELTSILGLILAIKNHGYTCHQIHEGLKKISSIDNFSIWSGGLRLHKHATGEQYASGSDDFVESQFWLNRNILGAIEFAQLQAEMSALDDLAKAVYGCVMGYFKAQLVDGKKMAEQASHHFWQLCERDFQTLLEHCENGEAHAAMRRRLRLGFAGYAQQAFDRHCPQDTARQLDAWAQHRPKLGKYLKQED